MRSLEQVNIRTNERTYVRTYSHTYVRDRPYIPSTTLLCVGIINESDTFISILCKQTAIFAVRQSVGSFCTAIAPHILSANNISELDFMCAGILIKSFTNHFVKQTML